jgi:enamine deaminase RidA (YjgF/YER057c/UK114 family)
MHLATFRDSRLVFIAGQVPLNQNGELVGAGDLREQARQCLRNLEVCLAEAGARPEDVVRTTVYVVATEGSALSGVWRELRDSDLGAVVRTPATLLGVSQLGYDGQLVEIEATAAIPSTGR